MKKLSNLINEKVTDVKWLQDSIQYVLDYQFPLTKSISKELGLYKTIQAAHFTDGKGAARLIAMQGSNKSLSVMTIIPKARAENLWGIHRSGVMYKVEGKLIFPGIRDMASSPDQRGRRWINLDFVLPIPLERYKDFLLKDPNYSTLRYKYYRQDNSKELIKKLISLHFDLSLEFVKENKKDFEKNIFYPGNELQITAGSRYDELIINNIKLISVVYDPSEIESKQLEQKIINSVPKGKAFSVDVSKVKGDEILDLINKAIQL